MTKNQLTMEQMRIDIASIIHEEIDEIGENDSLIDLGLDSMRAMNLVLLWKNMGVSLEFSELAQNPTLLNWWKIAQRIQKSTLEAEQR